MNTPNDIRKKIDFALSLIRSASKAMNGEPIEVAYSGGKDSDVILQLTKEAGVSFRAIYKNTTIDPPGTILHAKEMGVEVIKPKQTFFQLIAKKGFPNRTRRFCCQELKEYKILDKAIIGVRTSESTSRAKRYKEPTECRIYNKKEKAELIYPILNWSNNDCLWFIRDRKIKLHPLYYREDGTIDMSRRLGCLGCPLASKNKKLNEFERHPKLIKAYLIASAKYYNTHESISSLYDSIYDWLCRELFCKTKMQWYDFKHTLFGETDCKAYLEEYFKIKL